MAKKQSTEPSAAIPSGTAFTRRVSEAFGSQLQRVRREQGWKQDGFAEALGVSRTTVSNIERGQQRIFLDQAYRAAEILRVPVDVLLPPAQLVTSDIVVRTAADDPLPRAAARSLEEVVRELGSGTIAASRQPPTRK